MLREPNNIICSRASLCPFSQHLPGLEGIVGRLEVAQQCSLQISPTQHNTLHLKPGVGLALQQPHNDLALLYIIN